MTDQRLTDSALFQLVLEVQNGEAGPAEAKQIIGELNRLIASQQSMPLVLRSFLQDAFSKILNGESADKAFRLKRSGAGRPIDRATEEKDEKTALEVLRRRLAGSTLEEAAADVAERYHRGTTQVRQAFAKHKQSALILLRIERALDEYPWSPSEVERLAEIFESDEWFIPPGNSKNKPA